MSSISTQLEQKCGGRWRYSTGAWECDDGRYVVRQHTGGVDVNEGWHHELVHPSREEQ